MDGGCGGVARGTAGASEDLLAGFVGGLGTAVLEVSESDRYGEALSAPVSTPPALRSFGIPPANIPPSCGAVLVVFVIAPACPPSLLLLERLPAPGGARLPAGFDKPGIGGAPPTGGPEGPLLTFPSCGADRSLIDSTFFNFAPFDMSPKSAP